ncbi:MAG: hypothetical protein U0441_32975 [Polyangiaceae bacterium]
MADKRDLVVNDLSRYQKASGRLVLEDYSHCEVPAGCGGGILRWIDPSTKVPLKMWLWGSGKTAVLFDGAEMRSSRLDVQSGRHVLAIHLTPKEGRPPQIALALLFSDEGYGAGIDGPSRTGQSGVSIQLVSGKSLRLRAQTKEPPAGWTVAEYDDAAWTELRPVEPIFDKYEDWALRQAERSGAQCVGLSKATAQCWIRCTFEIALGGAK